MHTDDNCADSVRNQRRHPSVVYRGVVAWDPQLVPRHHVLLTAPGRTDNRAVPVFHAGGRANHSSSPVDRPGLEVMVRRSRVVATGVNVVTL